MRRRALVTGATGFIGSALCRALHARGWKVFFLARASSAKKKIASLPGVALIHDGTMAGMARVVRRAKPSAVFHLASLFLSDHESDDVEPLLRSNVLFGAQLLEAMSSAGFFRFVNTGTAWQHYRNADYSPVNLYAATKQAFEDILAYYAEVRGIRAVTLKIFDSYGPGDERPKLWKALRNAHGRTLKFSGGRQKIDPVYIDDIINAYLTAAERLISGKAKGHAAYAVSSGRPRTLKNVIDLYTKSTGEKINISWGALPYRDREVMRPWDKGKKIPGWRAKIDLKQGLRRMARTAVD
ncbi:MAG: NAD-dependent epimerase/dehydratase family protein [Elusimicrobiota bacterium]